MDDIHVLLNTSRSSLPHWPWPQDSQIFFVDKHSIQKLGYERAQLYRNLAKRARGPGAIYLIKAFLPWIFPLARRAVVLDFDLLFNAPIKLLWREFDKFNKSHIMGLAEEFSRDIYGYSSYGVNGGVQLLHLERMRNGQYEQMLRRLALSSQNSVGYLGDQNLYTAMGNNWPYIMFRLSCRFNFQLNSRRTARMYRCRDGCIILHGNDNSWKTLFRRMTHTENWRPRLAKELRVRGYSHAAAQCLHDHQMNLSNLET